jgi:hypothetical protein
MLDGRLGLGCRSSRIRLEAADVVSQLGVLPLEFPKLNCGSTPSLQELYHRIAAMLRGLLLRIEVDPDGFQCVDRAGETDLGVAQRCEDVL